MANSQTDMHVAHCSTGWPLAGQLLSAMLLRLIEGDDELRSQLDEARRRRLARLTVVKLAPEISPASFTRASLASFGERTSAPQWRVGTIDPWAEWIAQNIRRRVAERLTGMFDDLRATRLGATGFAPGGNGSPAPIPSTTWSTPAVTFDLGSDALLASGLMLFAGVEVQAATQPRTASRAAIDKFVVTFDAAMQASGRRYVIGELVYAAQQHLSAGVSALEVEAALRRSPVSARAGAGRRAAHEVPTTTELTAAASRAAEASSNPA